MCGKRNDINNRSDNDDDHTNSPTMAAIAQYWMENKIMIVLKPTETVQSNNRKNRDCVI